MKNLNNKVAAITGAGSGIGQALALNLAQQGCHLALSDINEPGLQLTKDLIKTALKDADKNPDSIAITTQTLDVANQAAVYNWAQQVVADHGRVNLIFNNAGVALSGTVAAVSIEDYKWLMDINFWGVVYGTKAFLPLLEASGDGHIVNISSVFGLTSQPLMSAYNASKFAVRGFTESLRQDLAITHSNVSTTCIHPGGIKTNIAKMSRMDASVEKITGTSNEDSIKEFEDMFITTPQKAAHAILKGVNKNKRRVLIGPDAKVLDILVRLFPTGYQWLFTKTVLWRSKRAHKKAAESTA
jgi:NAD(P)-dependent dehydrogenase (short-subunit alcohol dehydrogenase family)